MNRDQVLGTLILVGSIPGILLYGWLLFFTAWSLFVLQLTAFIGLGVVLVLLAWIGYTIATTPPPSIEEVEKELGTVESKEATAEEKKDTQT